ncbi:CRISPR-associated endonuclease Cas2 [Helcococcus ovis]|uniref:CRISPR-associated endoribonuclease Cas2 n=1 Tax=Helcococcus ovis TaxID=72026 RepID=A0A4R9C1M7_9FIRM|nr:CRISPR-associated endonuclease Cas2 [Helcococcus ovis]TFF64014.1 CRISPR-associated endonuclease Cas2 [Helcococcus ovis]TFF65967.1 CRISPR-associated endonuclease Cas2 [Helcococcus ovis]TFF68281.1 CRISPR-associated endonuclease Cas2 [Helcococcus ovis]WNZ00596.1 CRISPR-associated endonuclease Cas2 [Helcococcus ovis]
MIFVSYDIKDDKVRTKFSKYLSKYGYRIQYSIFCVKNSERILNLVKSDIENKFKKLFKESDSVMIYKVDKDSIINYGYPIHENDDIIIV